MIFSKRVVVTGAAGQIGYALLPMIAKGEAFGPNQRVSLILFDLPKCENIMKGIEMELEDLASPLIDEISVEVTPEKAFKDADVIFCLAGLMNAKDVKSRLDYLSANKAIYEIHGKAINEYAKKDCRILVVANPANTIANILMKNAPMIPPKNISSLNRLDQNRANMFIAKKLGISPCNVQGVIVWGNHSNTMVPDTSYCLVNYEGKLQKANDLIKDPEFYDQFTSDVRERGAKITQFRGNRSCLSSATAAVNHMHDLFVGTPVGHFSSMGICSQGEYGVPKDIFFSFPCFCKDGDFYVVKDLQIDEKIKEMLKISADEVLKEKQEAKL